MSARGFVVWLTGLSGAGKSTIAQALAEELRRRGVTRLELLDGDAVRENLSAGLGFSRADRDTNIRRIAWVAHLLARNGVATIVAAISPYRQARDAARALIGDFVEVFVDAPLTTVEARDVKGLYARARAGTVPHFTGVSDPYEPPLTPEVRCATDRESVQASAGTILDWLTRRGWVPAAPASTLAPAEEARILARLAALGYLEARG
jgi:adenylylsulfate kinase